MLLNRFELGDQDSRIYPVGYSAWLQDDETISDVTDVSVDNVTVPPLSAVGAVDADGKGITIQVGGGLADEVYFVSFTITTTIVSTGGTQTRRDCLEFSVIAGCS